MFRTVSFYLCPLALVLKDNHIKTFTLDRLTELEISRKRFQLPESFNVNDHFRYCFGITGPNIPQPEEVILSFDGVDKVEVKSMQKTK